MKIDLITLEDFLTVVDSLAQKFVKLNEILGPYAASAKESLIKNMTLLEAQGLALSSEVFSSAEDFTDESLEEFAQDTVNILNMLLLAGVDVRSVKAVEAEKFSEPFLAFMDSAVALRHAAQNFRNSSEVKRKRNSRGSTKLFCL